jgi:FkbM family methyltransferase
VAQHRHFRHKPEMTIGEAIGFSGRLHAVDIGAAAISEFPPYKPLLDRGLARLSAVDGDDRQIPGMIQAFGPDTKVHPIVLADGMRHTLYLCAPKSGMSSILKPSARQLAFFNGFDQFGTVYREIEVETARLADVEGLDAIDFLKMDIQGAELMVLENAGAALDQCVAIQLEASFIALYEDQPTFGQIDQWMRAHGFHPHRFMDVKRWSIAPTIRGNDIYKPFNQLLECDIVYMRGLVDLTGLSDDQVRKMLLIAAYCYSGPDLMIHCGRELERRGLLQAGAAARLLALFPKLVAASPAPG